MAKKSKSSNKSNLIKKVALSAAGLAVAAGAIATGVALRKKKNRNALEKTVKKVVNSSRSAVKKVNKTAKKGFTRGVSASAPSKKRKK